jgi:hypothetical protein
MTVDILHVAATPSFMGFVAGVFDEVAPGRNRVVSIGAPLESFALPGSVDAERVERDDPGRRKLNELVASSRMAVFHNVAERMVAQSLASAPPTTLRVWSGWGGDYYGGDLDPLWGLVGPSTRRLVGELRPWKYWPERLIELRHLRPALHRAAQEADVFSAPIPEDLQVFRRRFREFSGDYHQLNYASVEDMFDVGPSQVSGRDILLGNSATPENNHLEVLRLLARDGIGDAHVFAPLTYGDPAYADAIASAGRRVLGDRFVPITRALPLAEYHELLARCSVFVMGHRRQQALGNLLRALWQGSHLVLDRRNPMVDYLHSRGGSADVLGEVDLAALTNTPVSPVRHAADRRMLDEYWGRETILRNVMDLVARADSRAG